MGPQGSGKSTQARLLAEKYGMQFVSVGEILRELFEDQNQVGIEARQYWIKGELVPDDLIVKIVKEFFNKHAQEKDYVIDGFPRDPGEYVVMKEVFPSEIDAIVYINLAHDLIIKRLKKRAQIEKREDETEEAIRRRLEIAQNVTFPLLQKFKDDGYRVIEVDGSPAPEIIFNEICFHLEETHTLIKPQ